MIRKIEGGVTIMWKTERGNLHEKSLFLQAVSYGLMSSVWVKEERKNLIKGKLKHKGLDRKESCQL